MFFFHPLILLIFTLFAPEVDAEADRPAMAGTFFTVVAPARSASGVNRMVGDATAWHPLHRFRVAPLDRFRACDVVPTGMPQVLRCAVELWRGSSWRPQ